MQAPIAVQFGHPEMVAWLGNGFALGSVATILPYGTLYGKVNMKWLYMLSIIIFEVGSALCGAATDMNMEIAGRVIAGIGGSGIYLGGLNFISAITAEKERAMYIAGIGVCWGAGCVLGPIIGGLFSSSAATWRWSFYINLCIAAVCAPIYVFYIPSTPSADKRPLIQRLANLDYLGFFLSAGAWAFFAVLFTFAGAIWSYESGTTIAFSVLFGIFTLLFIAQQRYALLTTKEDRIFPAHLLHSRSQVMLVLGSVGVQAGLFVPLYYLPLYFEFAKGDSALQAAVHILPFIIVTIFVCLLSGTVLPLVNYYAPMYLVAGILIAIGGGLLHTITPTTSLPTIYGFSVLSGIGTGIAMQIGYTVATVKLVHKGQFLDVGHAISLQNVTQIGTSLVLLVISGQIFQTYAAQNIGIALEDLHLSSEDIHSTVSGSQSAIFQSLSLVDQQKVITAVTSAISLTYFVAVAFGALAVVAALAMKWERLFPKVVADEDQGPDAIKKESA